MKTLIGSNASLAAEGRWDLDFHLPPELIAEYPEADVVPVKRLASVSGDTRDPGLQPESTFRYVDIASVEVASGTIATPQELTGEEAPSRARMVIRAFDVIVSTVRPTRRAVAVVPAELDGQICSTGFTVLRCKLGVNPYFLHFLLRLPSTAEQFRKFATGSSYPAILDSDVLKTLVPAGSVDQDEVARAVVAAQLERARLIGEADRQFAEITEQVEGLLRRGEPLSTAPDVEGVPVTLEEIERVKSALVDEVGGAASPEPVPGSEDTVPESFPVDG